MAGKVLNIKACSLLKLSGGLTGKKLTNCHYSYKLSLAAGVKNETATLKPDYKNWKNG